MCQINISVWKEDPDFREGDPGFSSCPLCARRVQVQQRRVDGPARHPAAAPGLVLNRHAAGPAPNLMTVAPLPPPLKASARAMQTSACISVTPTPSDAAQAGSHGDGCRVAGCRRVVEASVGT